MSRPGRYGQRLHFWDLAERARSTQTIDLGEQGLVPLEVRWLHNPDAEQRLRRRGALERDLALVTARTAACGVEQVIEVDTDRGRRAGRSRGPGLITDLVVSMDDRFLYFSNWLHGDLRQYDISDPGQPAADGPALARRRPRQADATAAASSPAARRCSSSRMDGRRLYVTNSLYSTWDNQFYPELRSWLLRVDCAPEGGMEIDPDFFVDLHDRPGGPARAHEVRLQGGDCTTEIFASAARVPGARARRAHRLRP